MKWVEAGHCIEARFGVMMAKMSAGSCCGNGSEKRGSERRLYLGAALFTQFYMASVSSLLDADNDGRYCP